MDERTAPMRQRSGWKGRAGKGGRKTYLSEQNSGRLPPDCPVVDLALSLRTEDSVDHLVREVVILVDGNTLLRDRAGLEALLAADSRLFVGGGRVGRRGRGGETHRAGEVGECGEDVGQGEGKGR